MTAPPATYPVDRLGGPRPCPVLATDRLELGPLTLADWPDMLAFMLDDARTGHIGGPFDAATAWGWFCCDLGAWAITGSGAVAMRLPGGALAGWIALNDLPTFPEVELGWSVLAAHEGRGYASEGAAAVLAWVRAELRPEGLVSYVSSGNAASLAVARRLGARPDADADRPEPGDVVMRHLPAPAGAAA